MQNEHDNCGPEAQESDKPLPAEQDNERLPGPPDEEDWKNDVLRKVRTLLDLLNRRSKHLDVFL